jgi:amino acid transporter
MITGITLSVWSEVSIGISQLMYALGATTGNSGLVNLGIALASPGLNSGYFVATLLVIIFVIISVFGLRLYSWFQRAGLFLYYLSTAGFIVILLMIDPKTIPALFNSAMSAAGSAFSGVTYAAVTAKAASVPADYITPSVLAAIPWGFLTFTGFNYGAYLAGETRNVKTVMWRSLFVSILVTVVLLLGMSLLAYRDFSAGFINGAGYVVAYNGSYFPTPNLPTPTFLASLTSPAAAVFVGLSLIVGWIIVCVAYIVTISRMIFAASFDRLLPVNLASVSDRLHSPRNAVLVAGVISWVFVSIYMLSNSFFITWLQLGLISPIGYLLPMVATLFFPWVKKDLFKSTVGQFASKGGLAIASLIGVGSFAFYIVALSFPLNGPLGTVFLGSNLLLSYAIVAGVIIAGVVMFAWASSHARGIGVDLRKVYSSIPPE